MQKADDKREVDCYWYERGVEEMQKQHSILGKSCEEVKRINEHQTTPSRSCG